jgi:hypothetical protein
VTDKTTAADWRTYATPQAQQEFADAQFRLDHADFDEDGQLFVEGAGNVRHPVTRKSLDEDQKTADRYDRLVLQPAHAEFELECEQREFEHHFPEPANGSRIEWEGDGMRYGAFREDDPTGPDEYHWYMYGVLTPYSWSALLGSYEIDVADLVLLAEARKEMP